MKRRDFLRNSAFTAAGIFAGRNLIAKEAKSKKPNVIVIMTDDTGNNIGFQGNPHVKTPHIDRMAKESVRLSNFHQMPMCTASRAALMTGKYAQYTGAWRTSLGRTLMRADNITIAEAFKSNGYKTAQFGKWHLGDTYPVRPQDQGFDEVVGLRCGAVGQIADYWGNDYFDDTYYHNGTQKQYQGYCTDVFFNEAIEFIRENKASPFFIYLTPNITHLPLHVAEKYSKRHLANGVTEKLSVFYGMIDNLDENFGRLIRCLKEENVDENTILLFTTDDGAQGAAMRSDPDAWNMGLTGDKGSPEEGGHRVFSYLRWPAGNIAAGTDNNTLISVLDVYPTLLDLCGLSVPPDAGVQGRSFKPYLQNPLPPKKDERPIFFHYFNPRKLELKRKACVIWKNWRLVSETRLYDVSKDLKQEKDLAAKYPEVVKKMQSMLYEHHNDGLKHIKEPVRIVLGHPKAPLVEITSQDVYREQPGPQAFNQKHAFKLTQAHGPYKVRLARSGKYTFKLSRYPLYTDIPMGVNSKRMKEDFDIESVRMSIMGKTLEKKVTPQDTHASFTLRLKKGDSDLGTALIGDGKDGVAYFVTVEYND